MKAFSALLAFISTATAVDPASISSMSFREQAAFRDISDSCARDVENVCTTSRAFQEDLFLMIPHHHPLREMESFIDHIMVSSLRMPLMHSSFLVILEQGEEEEEQQKKPVVTTTLEERTVHHVLNEIAGQTPVEEIRDTAQRIADHGSFLLENRNPIGGDEEEDETHIRVARRLSEVTPQDLRERQQALLPYTAAQTACLRTAYSQGLVSLSCGRAIFRLDEIRDVQYRAELKFREDRAVVLVNLFCLYALVILTGMVIYWRRRKDIRAKRRLTRHIFQAIYSRPHLKQAVEREIGGAGRLGSVPPLPAPALWRMGLLGRELRGVLRTCNLVRFLFVTIVSICFVLAPLTTLPIVVGYAAAVFWCAVFSPKPVEICACCCCAATTESAKNGTLTEEQACCTCCEGTGVCSVQCASCCGPSKSKKDGTQDGCCSCCGSSGCCCCCSSANKVEEGGCCDGCCCSGNNMEEGGGCCDGCCCCCSGNNMEEGGGCCDGCCCSAKKDEKETVKAGCCCCCSGCCASGTCCNGAGCGSCCCCAGTCCCSAGGCCNKKQSKEHPQMVIYEGVPVQIV